MTEMENNQSLPTPPLLLLLSFQPSFAKYLLEHYYKSNFKKVGRFLGLISFYIAANQGQINAEEALSKNDETT